MSAVAQPGVIYFRVDGDPDLHFARRFGKDYWGMNRYRGLRLCGVENRRAGAALVSRPGESIRVRLVS